MSIAKNWVIGLSTCAAVAAYGFAWQTKPPDTVTRLFVEPFITKTDAAKLREDLTAELRKLSTVSLVTDQAKATLILGGGGEIWVRGYRSFSPRSPMKLPSNGTPIYGGYLSVELRNVEGQTLWSYLVMPEGGSEDVPKDLSKRITRQLAQALNQDLTSLPTEPSPQTRTTLKGAGATFPYPVYAKWLTNYRRENPVLEIAYDSIGSEAGVRRLFAGVVDFAASENPESIRELAPGEEGKYVLLPSVVGAVVPVVNLPGFPSEIEFTPEALAGIFLGKIKKWNDPILRQSNRGVQLPGLDIVVVHRSDGSGTSSAWTDFLSKTSPEWKAQVGSSLAPRWPVGRGADGNEGVA